MFCIMFLSILMFPFCAFGEPHVDYRYWRQGDSNWGSIRLGSSSCTMESHGCLVTSVAKLIVQAGLRDPIDFTPGTFVQYLNSNSGFDSGGYFNWEKASAYGLSNSGNKIIGSGLTTSSYESQIIQLVREGYHLVINVKNGNHWVAVDEARTLQNNAVYIMDSGSNQQADIRLTSRYSTPHIVKRKSLISKDFFLPWQWEFQQMGRSYRHFRIKCI